MESRKIFGCKIRQREDIDCPAFFVFYASSKDIKKWAGVKRAQDHKEGTQRMYRESRLKGILKYLDSNKTNTIPNNILISFNEGTDAKFESVDEKLKPCLEDKDIYNSFDGRIEWGFLSFKFNPDIQNEREHEKIALVIDGQHRLYGVSQYEENIPLLVVAILDATPTEQAFQFIVINNKAVRVPTNNVKGIIADITQIEDELNPRLMRAGVPFGKTSPELLQIDNMSDSPFQKLLDWTANETDKKIIPLTAIEQILNSYKKHFPKLNDDSDSLYQFLFAIWNPVRDQYPNLWGNGTVLMKKVVLVAMNEFFVERLKFLNEFGYIDIFEPEQVYIKVKDIISKIPEMLWTMEWNVRIQDNANMRELIKNDIEQIINNQKDEETDWFENLKLIKPNKDLLSSLGHGEEG